MALIMESVNISMIKPVPNPENVATISQEASVRVITPSSLFEPIWGNFWCRLEAYFDAENAIMTKIAGKNTSYANNDRRKRKDSKWIENHDQSYGHHDQADQDQRYPSRFEFK